MIDLYISLIRASYDSFAKFASRFPWVRRIFFFIALQHNRQLHSIFHVTPLSTVYSFSSSPVFRFVVQMSNTSIKIGESVT